MPTMKERAGKAEKKEGKQGLLMKPPAGPFKQKAVDGKTVIKETTPKEYQEAGDYWLGKKYAVAKAKENETDAAEKFLKLLDNSGRATVVIFDSEKNCKRRINVKQGKERLAVTTAGVND